MHSCSRGTCDARLGGCWPLLRTCELISVTCLTGAFFLKNFARLFRLLLTFRALSAAALTSAAFVNHGALPLLHGVLNGPASLAQGFSCWFEMLSCWLDAVGFQARDQARAAAERCVDCLAVLFSHEANI